MRKRDEGRCTFVSENGTRCPARALLQFDHVEPVARGGKSTVENVRLRCAAHNAYEADHAFGVEFMEEKRRDARTRAAARRSHVAARDRTHAARRE